MNENLEKEILNYIIDEKTGKPIPSRCSKTVLDRKGFSEYLLNRYSDNSTLSLRESIYRLRFGIEKNPVCANPLCNNSVLFNYDNNSYPSFCCASCRNNDPCVKEKNKIGVSESLKKVYSERGNEIKEKRAKSLAETNGFSSGSSSPFSYEKVRREAKNAVLEKYGVESVMSLPEFHSDVKERSRERSIILWKERGLDIEYKDDSVIIKNGCSIHGDIELDLSTFNNRTKSDRINSSELCPICNKIKYASGEEIALSKILDEYGIIYTKNDRKIIPPFELDFYIEDKNLAIEMNGIRYHNSEFKDKDYHKLKSEMCEKRGIQLIHIWEDEWITKKSQIISIIINRIGLTKKSIYARECEIRNVPNDECMKFLDINHLQGRVPSKYRYGLYYNNELVSVMTFGGTRKAVGMKDECGKFEMYRFCSKIDTRVVGGASKLFKYAIDDLKKVGTKSILTYAKRDISNGNLYHKLGFEFVGYTEPGYFYVNDSFVRKNRYDCRKSKIANTDEEKKLSESEIMKNRGFVKCFDSGNLKFLYNIE